MGFFTPNQQVDNFQTKVDSCTRPLAGQQFYPCIPDDALVQPLFGGNFVFQRREAGHITNREDIVRHQHGGWRGANSRDDTPGTVELFNGFNQQSAIAKTLRAFNATRQHDHVIFAISHFDQRRIRQQLHAARAGNRQVTIAGDAGSGDFDTAGDYSYLADILQTVLPDVAWHNNIRAELWRKLAVNCVINPLTAIWNCPNGELRHHPQEIMQICEEVAAVIEREGHHTSAEDLRDYVMQVIDATAENISSMLQDIRALRHTEIDYINGFLLRRARAHGIAVPENTRLFEMVKRKESEYERIGTGLPRPW